MHQVMKISEKNGDIYIAETEWENDRPKEYPLGYFQTAYFLMSRRSEGKVDVGQWLEFDAFHDLQKGWTAESKRDARISATANQAKNVLHSLTRKEQYHA